MEMFQYAFMQKAFIVGIMLSVIIPCVGIVVILRRLSMIGDALSHASLAGVATGLILNFNPVLGAIATAVIGALGIEFIRKKIPKYSEMSIAIIMSGGVGLAAILSGYVKNSANFNSFLFGSIVSISDFELYFVITVSIAVFCCFLLLYKELLHIAFDEESAILAGVPVRFVTFLFTILTGLTISISARIVGALIVSSMMVIPGACAMEFAKSYKQTVIYSICFAICFHVVGLILAYQFAMKPGGTIVLTGIFTLLSIFAIKYILKKRLQDK